MTNVVDFIRPVTLYFRKRDGVYLLLYVDDTLIAAKDVATVNQVKQEIKAKWKWTDLGEAPTSWD
jgi:hypothetical protein